MYGDFINGLIKDLDDSKERVTTAIIESDLPKIEKLKIIYENDLFEVNRWIQHPFKSYEVTFRSQLPQGGISFSIIDDFFQPDGGEMRGECLVLDMLEDMSYNPEDYTDSDGMVTILTDRCSKREFKISVDEFINHMYDWCIENETISWLYNW